jgi:hypothetical protein
MFLVIGMNDSVTFACFLDLYMLCLLLLLTQLFCFAIMFDLTSSISGQIWTMDQ